MDRWPWNSVCSSRYASATKIVQNDLELTLTFLRQGQIWEMLEQRFYVKFWKVGLKLVYSCLNENMKTCENNLWSRVLTRGQFQTAQKPLGQLKPNFTKSFQGRRKQKCIQSIQVLWLLWLPGPYMAIIFKYLLLRNKLTEGLETRVLPRILKWWPWVDLNFFYAKVQIWENVRT